MASIPGTTRIQSPEEVKAWHVGQIWQPPSKIQRRIDVVFRRLCVVFAALTVVLIVLLVVEIGLKAVPAFGEYGLRFLWSTTWDANESQFGILPEIWGTLYTSLLALFFGTLFGVAAAIFLSEAYLGEAVFKMLRSLQSALSSVLGEASGAAGGVAEESDRAAGRCTKRGLRIVGIVRSDPTYPANRVTGCMRSSVGSRSSPPT